MTEAARYFCDEHLKLLSESQVEKFVCFWCAQNKIAEREQEAATAALEQQWQPIQTAPKDGTIVLLWWPYWRDRAVIGYYDKVRHCWNSDVALETAEPPKGWMRLPSVPIAAIGNDKR